MTITDYLSFWGNGVIQEEGVMIQKAGSMGMKGLCQFIIWDPEHIYSSKYIGSV